MGNLSFENKKNWGVSDFIAIVFILAWEYIAISRYGSLILHELDNFTWEELHSYIIPLGVIMIIVFPIITVLLREQADYYELQFEEHGLKHKALFQNHFVRYEAVKKMKIQKLHRTFGDDYALFIWAGGCKYIRINLNNPTSGKSKKIYQALEQKTGVKINKKAIRK